MNVVFRKKPKRMDSAYSHWRGQALGEYRQVDGRSLFARIDGATAGKRMKDAYAEGETYQDFAERELASTLRFRRP